jgi:hypothetical protein
VRRGEIPNCRKLYIFRGNGNVNDHVGTGFFLRNGIISAVKGVEFVSEKMSWVTANGRWCDIIVENVRVPTEEKDDDARDNFHEELEEVFVHFPRYQIKIYVGDFSAKVRR